VNVVTGHPYEPQLAVSGIDHTVKIFSPDQAAQSEFLDQERIHGPRNDEENDYGAHFDCDSNHEGSRRRLQHEYRIRSQNDAMRDTGVQEALVTVSNALRILSLPVLQLLGNSKQKTLLGSPWGRRFGSNNFANSSYHSGPCLRISLLGYGNDNKVGKISPPFQWEGINVL